jgi:energy-converting hydrogenase Eha subunit A
MKLRFAMSTAMATAATLPLVLGLAACGAEKPAATGYKPSVPTSTPVVTTTTAVPQKVAPVAHLNRVTFVPAMKAAITKQKSWRITGKMTAEGSTLLTIDGVQTAQPAAMSMEMTGAAFQGKTAKMVVVKKVAYVSIPGMTPAGKYVKIDDGQAGDLGELLDGGDPTKIFKSFDSSMANVKFVRSEKVGGQMLDRYDVTVNTAKALAAQGKKVPAGVPKTLTYSLWMDKSNLVRKLTFDLAGLSMVMTMSDYNKPVTITAPPASKIVR